MDTSPFDPTLNGWRPLPADGFPALVGPLWYRKDDGNQGGGDQGGGDQGGTQGSRAQGGALPRFAMLADARHRNIHGIVHGGMVMTFADTGLGITVAEAMGRPCVTIQFACQFLDATRPGDFVELDAEILRRSSTVVFMRGTLRVGRRVTGAVDGVWKVIRGG